MSEINRNNSLWEESCTLPQFPSLNKNIQTEICVVGGGMSGLSTAYQLAKRGHKVALLEAYRIGSGNSGRTTAHLTYQLEDSYSNLLKKHGKDRLKKLIKAHRTAIDTIEKICEVENISCDFKRLDGFYFLGKNKTPRFLIEDKDAAADCGIDLDIQMLTPWLNDSVESLRYPRQAQFHPMKYMAGLVRVLKELDVQIFEHSHVREIEYPGQTQVIVTTDEGFQVDCQNLVVATNTPVNDRFHIHTKQSAYRTYVIGLEVTRKLNQEVLLWDTEDPYHYIRLEGDILIVGGEDHKTGQNPENESPFEKLESWARDNFAFIGDVKFQWSGQVFEPIDQIAYIGRNPGIHKNVYITTGEAGIGMTNSTIASLLIPDLIANDSHPWKELFDPSRTLVWGVGEFLKENLNEAIQYKDWITPSEVTDPSEIPLDTGNVMRDGLTKTCIYHEEEVVFKKNCAVCPHLGGIVSWNDVEKTWDCPVHGSRFNTSGKVIEGPSIGHLLER